MDSTSILESLGQQFDRLVLYAINRGIPDEFNQSEIGSVSLEGILEQTRVDRVKTPLYQLTAPGEHPVTLQTPEGEVLCHVRVRPAVELQAPLLVYHHGFAEVPYTGTWNRLLPKSSSLPAHAVAVQAPFHTNLSEPIRVGFSSVSRVYQMFAGSLRVIELLQEQFEQQGAAFTVVGGLSWGGVTSMLYEGLFQRSRAIIPLFASPDLAQVLWDAAELFNRSLPMSRAELDALFNFMPYYERCDPERVFAIMGKNDYFFRFEHHSRLYSDEALSATLPTSHVGAMWRTSAVLRQHVLEALAWAAAHPR